MTTDHPGGGEDPRGLAARAAAVLARRGLRWPVLAAVAVLSVTAALLASTVTFDASVETWFLDDDPHLVAYRDFVKRFQIDQTGVVALFCDEPEALFSPAGLAALARITTAVEDAPHIRRVRSLSNTRVFGPDEEGAVAVAPLMEAPPRLASEALAVKRRALDNPLVRGHLVSTDGRVAAVAYEVAPEGSSFSGKLALVQALERIAAKEQRHGLRVRLAGDASLAVAMVRYARRDLQLLAPAAVILVGLLAFAVFRRLMATFAVLATVLIALLWTFGLMGALGMQINVISAALVALVLAVGVADAIHVISHYHRQLQVGLTRARAIERSLAELLRPCIYTSLTTAAGLLALLTSDLKPLRDFGWLAAVGVGFALALSMTMLPALLHLTRPPSGQVLARQQHGVVGRLIALLGRPSRRRSVAVLALGLVLVLGALSALRGLEIGANPVTYLDADDTARQDIEAIDRAMGGTMNLEFMIQAPEGGLKSPEHLRRLARFQRWLEGLPAVALVSSPMDAIKEVHRVVREERKGRLPHRRALLAQLYLLLEGDEAFDGMVRSDYSVGRMTARVSLTHAKELAAVAPQIEQRLAEEINTSGLRVEMTGLGRVQSNMEKYLLRSQIKSFALAFALVTLFMLLLLRSARLVLLSLIPNLSPLVLGMAVMVLAGVGLDPGTVMIASVALGIVVDDTMHFMVRYQRRFAMGSPADQPDAPTPPHPTHAAVRAAMQETARPIIVTSLALAAGFSVLALGRYTPNVHFGVISAAVILLALFADLVLLPAALVLLPGRLRG